MFTFTPLDFKAIMNIWGNFEQAILGNNCIHARPINNLNWSIGVKQ